ncbi:MAG: hypothetical protein C0487_06200 [Leptothrix sp. (in: Bacteria)]|nr:hypothetical protein [Leptothrix sp. (in: b-proteobacteria)]
MASRILALFIWAAVAASLAYWGLRWLAQPTAVPANATAVSLDNAARGDMRKLLTGPAAAADPGQPDPTAASMLAERIKLLGVVAPRNDGDKGGLALLSVDGKPARAVRAGGSVDGDMVLLTVNQRGAEIGPAAGPATVRLDLPLLPAAATGSLPPPTGFTAEAPAPQQMPGARPDINSGMAGSPEGMPMPSQEQPQMNNNGGNRPIRPGGNRPL